MYFWSQDQMPMSYDQSKERYKAQMLYYVNKGRLTYIVTCIQCELDTLPVRSVTEFRDFKKNSESSS
jgi:hypothetical protein